MSNPVVMPLSLYQHEFITTFTGKRVNVVELRPEDICIEDIAHALSQLCRFTGHCRETYSVAEHSIIASRHVPVGLAFEALLHDAAEAYVNDLSRPLKHHPEMQGYIAIEQRVDHVVRQAFGLPLFERPPYMHPTIKDVDNKLVVTEARALLAESSWTAGHPALDGVQPLFCWPAKRAEALFLSRYDQLKADRR